VVDAVMDSVRQLMDAGVRALEHLEVLLIVSREPVEPWTLEDVRSHAMLARSRVDEAVAALERGGFLVRDHADPHFRLGERADPTALKTVRAAYERDRSRVVNAFFACNLDSLRGFASAFKVRR
jgi:hypothetical protein